MPVGSYSLSGETALTQIINTMPTEIAYEALDQLVDENPTQMKTFMYVGNFTAKRWRRLCGAWNQCQGQTFCKDPLEV